MLKRALLVVVAVGLAALAWKLASGGSARSAGRAAVAPKLVEDSPRDVPSASLEAATQSRQAVSEARETLVLTALDPEGHALPDARLSLVGDSSAHAAQVRELDHATDRDGVWRIEVPAGLALRVSAAPRLEPSGARWVLPELAVDALKPGESRSLEVRFVVDCRETFVASFVRAEDGGALTIGGLYLLRVERDGDESCLTAGAMCAPLDAQGTAAVCVATWEANCCLVRAPDRAPEILVVGEGQTLVRPSSPFALERSATLVLHVIERTPSPTERLEVELRCEARSLLAREQKVGTTLGHAELRWWTAVDAQVETRAVDLPVRVPLELRVRRASTGAAVYVHPQALILDPGEVRELTIEVGSLTKLTVSVLDEHEHPIAGCELGLTQHGIDAAAGQEHALVFSSEKPDFLRSDSTDNRGRCVFADLPPGVWWVGLAPTRAPWDELDANAPAPIAQRIEILANEAQHDLTLHTTRGLYLRGRVEVPDGMLFAPGAKRGATPNVILIAHSVELGSTLTGQPEFDGSFAIGPLLEGEYVIETFARGYAPIEPLRVRAGAGPVVIRMQLGSALSGHVVDGASGANAQCDVVITRIGGATPEMLGSTDDQGLFGFSGLAPGEYVISAFASDGRTGMTARQHIEAGDAQGDIPLRLEPPESCGHARIVLEGAIAPGRIALWQDGVCRCLLFVDGASVRTVATPPGELEARLFAGQQQIETRKLSVSRGETAELRIRR
jgi:hypothetical protein